MGDSHLIQESVKINKSVEMMPRADGFLANNGVRVCFFGVNDASHAVCVKFTINGRIERIRSGN
jgi:hypothetical protein